MQRLTDFLAMGGYAAFVWPAYAVTIVVIAALVAPIAAMPFRVLSTMPKRIEDLLAAISKVEVPFVLQETRSRILNITLGERHAPCGGPPKSSQFGP